MAFFPWHIEVDDLVLVRVIDIVGCFDVKFSRLLILDNCAKRLRDGIEEGGLSNSRVSDDSDLESEVIVIDLPARQLLLLLEKQGLIGRN